MSELDFERPFDPSLDRGTLSPLRVAKAVKRAARGWTQAGDEVNFPCPLGEAHRAYVCVAAGPGGDYLWCDEGCEPIEIEAAVMTAEADERQFGPRLALVSDQNGVGYPSASPWDDVPLGGILDDLATGTLVLPSPTVGMVTGGSVGLFYPGRVNGLAGESGAGKGWIALSVCAEQMRLGHHSFYLDFEDSPALVVLRLVTVLEIEPQIIRDHFSYLHPANHDEAGIAALVERVSQFEGAFVVIDSTGESIAAAGLNQNHDEEVARWMQSLAHPLADRGGATVLLIDHMVKSEDGGLWPIGSQRKRAAITGAQYVAEVVHPFSKDADGMVALKVAKDRHGAREARSVASYVQFVHDLQLVPQADGTSDMVMTEKLSVMLGPGKTPQQVQADRDARAAKQLDSDVAEIDRMNPKPTSYRDVKTRLSWNDKRSQAAMREWKARQKP